MVEGLRFLARRAALGAGATIVTSPLVRWTWAGLSDDRYHARLPELRPTDRDSVYEMMQGRYLLAAKLVDTNGVSPFAQEVDHAAWLDELHGFSWLRHFRDVRDEGTRRFARTLVLDWIGRHHRYSRRVWSPILAAQRVLNWLRHYSLLVEGASAEQAGSVARALNTQVQSLRLRAPLIGDPVEQLFAQIALVGAALCHEDGQPELERRMPRLERMLALQLDGDGLHLSRNPRVQFALLTELATVLQAVRAEATEHAATLGAQVDSMYTAMDAVILGSGQPVFFNGCGQLPHDLLVSAQGQGGARWRRNGVIGGYGTLVLGRSAVVADSGHVPPPDYSFEATASALGFEFSHGSEFVFGSCGPAPFELLADRDLFRAGSAFSAATIDGQSEAEVGGGGRLRPLGQPPELRCDAADNALVLRAHGFEGRFGVTLERRITLLAGGTTLVGQDRMLAGGRGAMRGTCAVRFHLGPNVVPERASDGTTMKLRLPSGALWTFLWEGAALREEESVRQSALFGFHRTRQLVLEAPVAEGQEIAWIFTLEEK